MLSDAAKLVRAAGKGDDAKVKRLLKAKADVDYVIDGYTALRTACFSGHVGAARLLLKANATVDLERTVKEINAAFGERAGELKKPAKRVGLIDMGLIHLFMM